MQVGVKVQVLLNGEVFVQAELLRHVADASLNLVGMGGDIDIQHPQFAGIGF